MSIKVHKFDITCMGVLGNLIFTGGADGYLSKS